MMHYNQFLVCRATMLKPTFTTGQCVDLAIELPKGHYVGWMGQANGNLAPLPGLWNGVEDYFHVRVKATKTATSLFLLHTWDTFPASFEGLLCELCLLKGEERRDMFTTMKPVFLAQVQLYQRFEETILQGLGHYNRSICV